VWEGSSPPYTIYVTTVRNTTDGLHKQDMRLTETSPTGQYIVAWTDEYGVAKAIFRVKGTGNIVIVASQIYGSNLSQPPSITVTGVPAVAVPGVPVASIKLSPHKAHRHCGDSITITAVAKDASGALVAGAKITFLAHGDCHPANPLATATTNANGVATYTLSAEDPGIASVVAAGVDAAGAAVLSNVVHVYYEGHHPGPHDHYMDSDREY
jgi:hypothetical protein